LLFLRLHTFAQFLRLASEKYDTFFKVLR
jgi:hypothetical protein